MKPIALLVDTLPSWAEINEQKSAKLVFTVSPPSRSGVPGTCAYDLVVTANKDGIRVSELVPGTWLPAFCIERHINPGSTFCLYLNSEQDIQSLGQAQHWWNGLQAYLQHQQYAEKFCRWPIEAQMSHGPAAEIQLKMEEVAAKFGWKQEILAAIFRKKGWLGGKLPRLTKDGERLANARSPCPRQCTRKHHPYRKSACQRSACMPSCCKQHPPILRVDCPSRSGVENLVRFEHVRRKVDALVIKELKEEGWSCCGRMEDCPLANIN